VLDIGEFSGVQIDSLDFALKALSHGSVLSQAEFIFNEIPILLVCRGCNYEYTATLDDLTCPDCREANYTIIRGKEMLVKTIEGVPNG